MESLYQFITSVNQILLNNFLVYLLLAVGIFFTFKLGFIQFSHLGLAFKKTFGAISFKKTEKADAEGMSSI